MTPLFPAKINYVFITLALRGSWPEIWSQCNPVSLLFHSLRPQQIQQLKAWGGILNPQQKLETECNKWLLLCWQMLKHIQKLASVRFGRDWLNWNSLSLLCFDAATLNRKCPFIYPERFASMAAWPSGGDSRQINAICGICFEQYPARLVKWDGDLSGISSKHPVCSESTGWLHHIANHVWIYGQCVRVGVSVGGKDRKMQLLLRLLHDQIARILHRMQMCISAHIFAPTHTLHQLKNHITSKWSLIWETSV